MLKEEEKVFVFREGTEHYKIHKNCTEAAAVAAKREKSETSWII